MSTLFPVVIASGFHLFPFRTEKLSPTAPMVLRKRESRSPPSYFQVEALPARLLGGLFVSLYRVNAALFRIGPMRRCFVAPAALFRYDCSVVSSRLQCSLFCPYGRGASRRAALRFVGVSRLCSRKHSRRRRGEYRNINTPESHAELSGVCRFLICGDVWNQYQSIYCCALSCRSIASAACFPSPIARMTVAPPLTMSPPA